MLLEQTPKPQPEEPRGWRKDEYPFLDGPRKARLNDH
jgi:hypothetical protein